MARVIIIKDGKQVASGKNLEVLSRYNRKEPVVKSTIRKTGTSPFSRERYGGGVLSVTFRDGAKAPVKFADFVSPLYCFHF